MHGEPSLEMLKQRECQLAAAAAAAADVRLHLQHRPCVMHCSISTVGHVSEDSLHLHTGEKCCSTQRLSMEFTTASLLNCMDVAASYGFAVRLEGACHLPCGLALPAVGC